MCIVITGTSNGIGRELARRLVSHGHEVWGFARQAQDEIPGSTGSFRSGKCDVGEWSNVERVAASVADAWPHVDGLVTCAGIQGEVGRTLAADPIRWNSTVRVNLEGTFNALRGFADLLAKAPRRAKIVCFSGGGATKPRPNFSAYGVAKTGVVRLVETIAEEERGRPIDINAIAPGAINTRLTDEVIALGPDKVGRAEYATAQKTKAAALASTGSGNAPQQAALEKALGLV